MRSLAILLLLLMMFSPLVKASWITNTWEYGDNETTTASADNILAVACTASYDHFKLHMAFVPSGPFVVVPAGFSAKLVIDDRLSFRLHTKAAANSEEIMFYDLRKEDIPLLEALRSGTKVKVLASFGSKTYAKTIPLKNSGKTIDLVMYNCKPRSITKPIIAPSPTVSIKKVPAPREPRTESTSDVLLRRQRELVEEGQTRTLWYFDVDAEQIKDESFEDLEYLLDDYNLQSYK